MNKVKKWIKIGAQDQAETYAMNQFASGGDGSLDELEEEFDGNWALYLEEGLGYTVDENGIWWDWYETTEEGDKQ